MKITHGGSIDVAGGWDMATRAEQFRTEEQRHAKPRAARRAQAKKKRTTEVDWRARATCPAEQRTRSNRLHRTVGIRESRPAVARIEPSRTRISMRESLVKGSPEARFRKARAKNTRVRGSKH
jgi:hypothetical protein